MAFVNPDSFANAVLASRKNKVSLEDALEFYEQAVKIAQVHNTKEPKGDFEDADLSFEEQDQLLRDKGIID